MIRWKNISISLFILFLVSLSSSTLTWLFLREKTSRERSWPQILQLSKDQEKAFAALEADLNGILKEMDVEDAKNKMILCSYLQTIDQPQETIQATAKKMAENYEQKQEKIAQTLLQIAKVLTPEQKKIFSRRLMKDICESCREATNGKDCICGMCQHKT